MLFHIVYDRKTGTILCKYREVDAQRKQFRQLSPEAVIKEIGSLIPPDCDAGVLVSFVSSPADLQGKRVDPKRQCLVDENVAKADEKQEKEV
ncbi:MAG: hypothetical protein ACFFCW_26020 [Candidatus Hodarchaeota archaeon]